MPATEERAGRSPVRAGVARLAGLARTATGAGSALAAAAFAPGLFGDLDTTGTVLALLLLVLSLTLHEVAHGWVALQCGDTTARDLGRLTVNPLPHIDPFMTVIVPAMFLLANTGIIFGGAKPVPVAFHRLRRPWRDMMLVALAGPLTNVLLAVFFYFLYATLISQGLYEATQRLPAVLLAAFFANVLLAVFNLVPIPPLDGSRVMSALLPPSLRAPYLSLERFGLLIVLAVFWLGPRVGLPDLGRWVQNGMSVVIDWIVRLGSLLGIG